MWQPRSPVSAPKMETNSFKYFKTSPEIIRLTVTMYVRFPLSLRNVEDLLHERGIDIRHETIRVGAVNLTNGCRIPGEARVLRHRAGHRSRGSEKPV